MAAERHDPSRPADDFATTPYWWEDAPPVTKDGGAPSSECDVAVIGAGYTGLAAAIGLARGGRSVQVFDAIAPGEGASTRNGGIASGNLRLSLGESMRKHGPEAGLAQYREGVEARADLAAFVQDEKIDCDYRQAGRFTGAISPIQIDAMKREADLLNRHFDLGAYIVARKDQHEEVGTESYHGGMVRTDLATLHPARLHAGMMRVAESAGARIFGNCRVAGYRRDQDGFEVATRHGTVRARDLVVATNGYVDKADPWLRRRVVSVKSRIVVTGELPADLMARLLPRGRAMGESRRLYRYYRPTPDGQRILLGARETLFSRDERVNATHVHRRLLELFPEVEPYGLASSWNGDVAFTRSQRPELFVHQGAIYACGYCGSGVVWARWLGAKAAQHILGLPGSATAFAADPPRAVPLFNGKAWFLPAAMALDGLRDRLTILRARRRVGRRPERPLE